MKKIIAAFDGLRFSESTMQYAIWLASQEKAQLTGVFLSESTRMGYEIYQTIVEQSIGGKKVVEQIDKADAATWEESIHRFEAACRDAKISYTIHRDNLAAAKELLEESVFADLLVIQAEETFSYIETSLPGSFIKQVLQGSGCPVILVPRKFIPVKKFILLYDGNPSAVFAMKMFAYTMPVPENTSIEIIYAEHGHEQAILPHDREIREWAKAHFPEAEIKVLKGGEADLPKILSREGGDNMIVAGAYERSAVSMLFHKSAADAIMNKIAAPLFIAHT